MPHQYSPPNVPYSGWAAAPTAVLQPFYININFVPLQVHSFLHAAALYGLPPPPHDIAYMHQEATPSNLPQDDGGGVLWDCYSQPQPPLFPHQFYTPERIDLAIPPQHPTAMHGGPPPHDLAYMHQGGGGRWDFHAPPPHPIFLYQETLDLDSSPLDSPAMHGGGNGLPHETTPPPHTGQIYSREISDLNLYPPESPAVDDYSLPVDEWINLVVEGYDQSPAGLEDNIVFRQVPLQTDDAEGWVKPCDGLTEEEVSCLLVTTTAEDGCDGDMCVVCQDDLYGEDSEVGVLCCRHRFHADCIGKWLQKKNSCPLCNSIGIDIY